MTAKRPAADPLESSIELALRPGDFISWRAGMSFVSGLEEVSRQIAKLVRSGGATRAVQLHETFIAACYEKADEVDDSGGEFGAVVGNLFAAWIKARQAAGTDPHETAQSLLSWMENDPYGFCDEQDAVKAFDKGGLVVFEQHVQRQLDAAATSVETDGAERRRKETSNAAAAFSG